MKIIPAIDLLNGRCVRLQQGNYQKVSYYRNSAVTQALLYQQQGARQLHLVDLEAARSGRSQFEAIKAIKDQTQLSLQVGGGCRNEAVIDSYFDIGVDRVVLGSIAVNDPSLVRGFFNRYGSERIVLALDVKSASQPMVMVNGWLQQGALLADVLANYQSIPDINLLCTDISRDGMLQGPSVELYQNLLATYPNIALFASGGISSALDISRLKALGCSAAIIGKALLDERFSLTELLEPADVN